MKAALMMDRLERMALGAAHTFGQPAPVVVDGAANDSALDEAVAREASLKIPLKEAMREGARELAAQLDAELQVAIERALGEPLIDLQRQVKGRLTAHPDPIDPWDPMQRASGGETYAFDGKAILWAGPVKTERFGDRGNEHMRVTRQLRHLLSQSDRRRRSEP
ncbi:MAG: hypothetical protein AB7E83_24860 [Ramlibacter sp.]